MANIIVLEDDARVERQIKLFIKELDESHQVRFYQTSEVFDKKYCFSKEEQAQQNSDPLKIDVSATGKATDDELFQLLSSVDIVIFKTQCVKEEVRGWVSKTLKGLKANKFCTNEKPARFIVTKYEDDGIEKDYFIHPLIEDIIFLPLDRLIFLQKLEIILNLPRRATPSFLFSLPVEQQIEISKKTIIERVSDMGLAIRNPFKLAAGTISHFYFKFPNQKETLDIYARALYSEPHPEVANQFLVYYVYVGLNSKVAQNIKKFLTGQTNYKELENDVATAFRYRAPLDPKAPLYPEKTVAILDVEQSQADLLEDVLKSEIDRLKIVKESSLYFFVKKFIEKEQDIAIPGTKEDLFTSTVSWSVKMATQNLVEVSTKPTAKDLLAGHGASTLFGRPTGWLGLFTHADAKAMLEEAFTLAKAGQKFTQNIVTTDASGVLKLFSLSVSSSKDKETARLELSIPDIPKKKEESKKISALDCMIVSQSLIPDNVDAWLDRVKEVARKNGVIGADQEIPLIIVAEEKAVSPKKFRYSKIFGLVYRPFKNRLVCYHVSSATGCPFTKYNHTNIGWVKCIIPVHVAIESRLENLSEYGATIIASRPFAAGTSLYLHDSIYQNAPEGNLCARFYFAEENKKEKGKFSCFLLYFGITDGFLKFTRNWIRKDFAEKKQSQG